MRELSCSIIISINNNNNNNNNNNYYYCIISETLRCFEFVTTLKLSIILTSLPDIFLLVKSWTQSTKHASDSLLYDAKKFLN